MDLSHPPRTLLRTVAVLAVIAGVLVSAQLASAASLSSATHAVRVKVIKLYGAYTIAKSVQVKCKQIHPTRFGCYYLVPIVPKRLTTAEQKTKVLKTRIMLGNVIVRYRHNRPRMTFLRPTCLGSGCTKKTNG